MNTKKTILIFSLLLSILTFSFSYDAVVSPYIGYHYMDQAKDHNNSWEIGAYYTDKISENLFLDYNIGFIFSKITSLGEDKLLVGGGANALYLFPNKSIITPYLLAGIGGVGGYQAKLGLDLGFGCFLKIADNFEPRFEVKNLYFDNNSGNDTIYQIIFYMPTAKVEQKKPEPVAPVAPIIPEIKEPVKKTYFNELEEVFKQKGKVEKMNMKINFNSGASAVKSEYEKVIQNYAEFLLYHPEINLIIKGYTDNQGDKKFNQQLSELRAKSVANVLIYKFGVNKKRIIVQGLGEADPVATNNTEAGRALNRRIEASTF
ncbi:MAG: OmpA family protein [Candidatus Margulisbacteria bacterium]|nr:OmpA family protein [Candidatus Margulisiibacteriota bacterium]